MQDLPKLSPGGPTSKSDTRVSKMILESSPARQARKWQALSLCAGLLLAACFFLPAAKGCNATVVPSNVVFSEILAPPPAGDWSSVADWMLQFAAGLGIYLVAYLFGVLVVLGAIAGLARRQRVQRWAALGAALLLAYASASLLVSFASGVSDSGWPGGSDWPVLCLFLIWPAILGGLLTLVAACRRQRWQRYCLLGGITGLVWFGYFAIEVDALYGLYLSLAASLLICVAAVGETAAITGRSCLKTLALLLLCRPLRSLESRGHCPKCDYYLYGLTEQRCPECGRPFTFDELGATAAELSFAAGPPPQ